MKPKSALRNFLALAGSSILAISSASAITLYWDGATSTANADGGAGAWNGTDLWDTLAIAGANASWTSGDSAVFGGLASTGVTTGAAITTSGIQFNTTGYTITADATNTLSFSAGDNKIIFNNIAAAKITGTVANTAANIILSTTAPATLGTLTFDGASATGWSGTTTINAGMTLATVSTVANTNKVLNDTSGITLNGGTIQFTRDGNTALGAITGNAIGVNGGGTFSVTSTNGGASAIEEIGAVTVNSGQMNFVQTANNANELQLTSLSRGASTTSAVTFSSAAFGTARFKVGTGTTAGWADAAASNSIHGPWATVGTTAALQTDYAVFNGGYVVGANTAASLQGTWTDSAKQYTNNTSAVALSGNRTMSALRNTAATATITLSDGVTGYTLATNGILNGVTTLLTIAPGTPAGSLTAPGVSGGEIHLNAGSGAITVSAPINNNGGNVTLVKNGSGTLTLSSTTSNFSGGIVLNAGTLSTAVDANLGASSNGITVNGNVTWAPSVGFNRYDRSITINEGAVLNLNGQSNVTISGALSGNGTYVTGGSNGYNFTNTNNTFTGTVYNGYITQFASLGDSSNAINLSGSNSTFIWTGGAKNFALRPFTVNQTLAASNTAKIVNSGSGALTIQQDLAISGAAGARTLQLGGTNLHNNTFSGNIADGTSGGASVVSLTKADAGIWTLSNSANSYTGVTTITAGTLAVSTLANGSSNSSIGASSNAASNLVFGAATAALRYTGSSNVTTDRSFTMFSSATVGGATIESSGTGTLSFDNTIAINYGTTNQTRVLTLGGTNTGDNTFGKVIANNGVSTNAVGVTKAGIGKWVLTQTNTYTGATSINNGSLEIQSGAGNLTQTLGTLAFAGSDGTLISNVAGAGNLSTTFTTLTARTAGNTGNIVSTGVGSGTNSINFTQAAGFIDKGFFFNGADYAAMNGTNTVRALNYATTGGDTNTVDVGTITSGRHVKLTSTPAAQNSVSLLSLNLAGGTVGWTNNAGQTLTVPGIIKSGGGASTISGGTLATGNVELVIRTDQAADSLTINSALSGSGGLTKSGAGTLTLSGLNTYTGTTSVNGGTLSLTRSLATNGAININGAASFTQSGTGLIANNPAAGSTSFTQNSTGTSTLSLANTYTGTTTVNAGTLAVTNGLALQNSMLTLTGGTTTYSGGSALTVGGLNIAFGLGDLGSANVLSGYTGAVSALTLNATGTATFGGAIGNGSGAMTLTKTGTSTQTLQGANTYTGATTITAGTLNLSSVILNNMPVSNGSILATSGINLNGGGLTSTNVNNIDGTINRINDNAGISVNGLGTFTYTNTTAGGAVYAETLGAVTLNYGQFNVVLSNNQTNSNNSQTLTLGSSGNNVSGSGLARGDNSAVTFSSGGSLNTTTNRIAVYGATTTSGWVNGATSNPIIGPWASVGTAATSQSDYAVYSGGYVIAAGTVHSGQSNWTDATKAYALNTAALKGAAVLSETRNMTGLNLINLSTASELVDATANTVTWTDHTLVEGAPIVFSGAVPTLTSGTVALRTPYYVRNVSGNTFQLSATPTGALLDFTNTTNFAGMTPGILLSTGNNLGTTGLLSTNGTTTAIVATGTGVVTLPSATSASLYATTGGAGNSQIFIAAPIADNGAGKLTLVKSGVGGGAGGDNGLLVLAGNNTFTGGLVLNAGTVRITSAQSFTGGVILNGGVFGDSTDAISAAELYNNSITVNGVAAFGITNGEILSSSSSILINSTGNLSLASTGTGTVNGALSGTGTLTMTSVTGGTTQNNVNLNSTANTFTGGVVILPTSNGGFNLGVNSFADSASPGTGNIVMAVNGAVNSVLSFSLNSGAVAPMTFTNRQFGLTGNGSSQTVKIANNSSQAFTINSNLDANNATGTKTLTLGGGTLGGLSTFAGNITNGALDLLNITKTDNNNTWALSGANTYNGKTTISAGTLSINSIQNASSTTGNSLGTPGVGANSIIDIANTGTLRYTGSGHSSDRVINNTTTNGGGITLDASGASGTFALTGGVTTASTSGTSTVTLTGTGLGSQSGSIVNGTGTNVTAVTKSGTGTWTLSGNNTYTGVTTVSGGVLKLNHLTALSGGIGAAGGTSALTLTGGGVVGLANGDFSRGLGTGVTQVQFTGGGGFAAYGADRTVNLGGAAATATWNAGSFVTTGNSLVLSAADADSTLIFANPIAFAGAQRTIQVNNGSAAIDARLTGALTGTTSSGLNKTGAGTLEITGTGHTYAGATTVAGGKLLVNANISTSILTTVQTGATLGGTGSVGALTIDSGGYFAPGNSPGTTTVNGAYIQNGTLQMEITGLTAGAQHDQVVVNGSVTLNGLLSLTTFSGTYAENNMIFLLLNDGGDAITGTFTGLAQGDVAATYGGFDWQISYTGNSAGPAFTGGNDVVLMAVAVPEPGAALIGGLGLLALLRRRR